MAKKKSKGGRPKSTDPRVQINFYLNQSIIDRVGGMDKARKIGSLAIKRAKPVMAETAPLTIT